MKKEIPMLMSTPMVIATDNKTKTETRRTKSLERINEHANVMQFKQIIDRKDYKGKWAVFQDKITTGLAYVKCPYGEIGDHIWVRETMYQNGELGLSYVADNENIDEAIIPDDYGPYGGSYSFRNIPCIHMPKWAARIWLEITDIKIERLHSITESGIISEGVQIPVSAAGNVLYKLGELNSAISFLPKQSTSVPPVSYTSGQIYFAHWAELWCGINGRASWDLNPWVWVVKFKKINN